MVASSSTSDSDRQRSRFCSSSPRGRTGPLPDQGRCRTRTRRRKSRAPRSRPLRAKGELPRCPLRPLARSRAMTATSADREKLKRKSLAGIRCESWGVPSRPYSSSTSDGEIPSLEARTRRSCPRAATKRRRSCSSPKPRARRRSSSLRQTPICRMMSCSTSSINARTSNPSFLKTGIVIPGLSSTAFPFGKRSQRR